MQKKILLEVKDIHDDFRVAIPQHNVASNGDAFAIGRRRGKPALKFDGNKDNAAFQAWRKRAAKHKLPLKPRRQAVSLGEARREVSIVIGVPTPKFASVMFGKPVPTAIIIVVVVSVSIPIPPPRSLPCLSLSAKAAFPGIIKSPRIMTESDLLFFKSLLRSGVG